MIKWLKKLRNIVSTYDSDLRSAHARIGELEAIIRERTNIAVDVNFRGANHVIVIGRYKNADFIQTYSLPESDLSRLIDQLREMEKYAQVRRVDVPQAIKSSFKW